MRNNLNLIHVFVYSSLLVCIIYSNSSSTPVLEMSNLDIQAKLAILWLEPDLSLQNTSSRSSFVGSNWSRLIM